MTKIRYLGLLLILPLFTVTIASTFTVLPHANALTKGSFANDFDSHTTARFGNTKVCGNHLCVPGEFGKLKEELNSAQITKGGAKIMLIQGAPQAAPSTESKDLGSVLRLSNANLPVVIPLVKGLYDGKDVFYITTEASNSDVASALTNFTNFPVTFAPALVKTPPAALAQFYVFKNGIKGSGELGFQPTISDSIPGDPAYSPLWQVNYVTWKNPTNATVLGSDNDVTDALNQGKITVDPTNVVVNAPIIQWSGNKQGTISAGNMKIRNNMTEFGAYGSAQVLNIDTQNLKVTFVAHRGFAPDGSTIYYIATDASQTGPANTLGVVFANKTQATISTSSAADLYQFSNGIKGSGPLGFQSGVASAKAGDQYYSPMWRIQVISWKDPSMATVLENTHDITSKSGLTTTMEAGFVVNCPFFSLDTVYAHIK